MQTQMTARVAAAVDLPASGSRSPRLILALMTAIALVAACTAVARTPAAPVDADFVRVIRFMALIKGSLAFTALAACFWRLARTANSWRLPVYVMGPPFMVAGAIGLLSMQNLGISALGLHLGLFAVLAAALTDPDFMPDLPRGRVTVWRSDHP